MKCEEYFVLLCGHLDGMNAAQEEQKLQAHLDACESCRIVLAQMKENDAALRERQEVPADLAEKIMQKVRKEPKKRKKQDWSRVISGLAVAAVLALVLLGSNNLLIPHGETEAKPEIACEGAAAITEALLEPNEIVVRSSPMESACPEPQTTLSAASISEDAEKFITGSYQASLQYNASASTTKPSVLFIFASEVAELENRTVLDMTKVQLPQAARERFDALAPQNAEAYRVTYLTLQQLKMQYPSEYFDGYAEDCYVIILPAS